MSLNSNKLKITFEIEVCLKNWVQRKNEYIIDQMISISTIVIIVHLIML